MLLAIFRTPKQYSAQLDVTPRSTQNYSQNLFLLL